MDFRFETEYDASPAAVFAMLCDEDFRVRVCEATRATTYDVAVAPEDAGSGAHVRIRRVMPADVPDIAKKFVGDTIEIVQTETWGPPGTNGCRSAELSLEIPGKPASMRGTIAISPYASSTHEVIEGQLKVSVPLIGGKLEAEIARGVNAALEVEARLGREWLAAG